MIVSVLENRLIHGDLRGQLTPGVLYVASDSKRFYLADANGFARPADQQDPALFASLLESEIPQAPTPQWAAFLQNTLNALVSSPQPPAPARYPEVGDTNVSGSIVWVRTLPTDNPKFTCGKVRADIAANGYSTPDASVQPPINFDFDFYINPPVNLVAGQAVRFNIVQSRFAAAAEIQ